MKNLHRAFSLIELLLALSIFSMVALCVYGTFWAGVKINQRAEGENGAYRQIRLALDLMSVDLENAAPYDFTGSYPEQTAFKGEDDAVTFLLASGKGLKVIRYYLDSPQEGSVHKVVVGARHDRNVDTLVDYREQEVRLRNLVREERDFPEYVSGVIAKDHAAEVIATNVREDSLEFSYGYLLSTAGSEGNKTADVYEWREAWTQSNIPLMMRIEMDFLLSGPARRMVAMRKDVLIPHGSWGKPEKM
jgi:prepilin-type N-terminal cleavage/methylation domain-containing protein